MKERNKPESNDDAEHIVDPPSIVPKDADPKDPVRTHERDVEFIPDPGKWGEILETANLAKSEELVHSLEEVHVRFEIDEEAPRNADDTLSLIFQALSIDALPLRRRVSATILDSIRSSVANADTIAQTIKLDPSAAVTVKLLGQRLSLRSGRVLSEINEIVAYSGLNYIENLVAFSNDKFFSESAQSAPGLSSGQMTRMDKVLNDWTDHNYVVAAIAEALVHHYFTSSLRNKVKLQGMGLGYACDLASMAGLFHDIGIIVAAGLYSDDQKKMQYLENYTSYNASIEVDVFGGADHCTIGFLFARYLKFPLEVCIAILCHHNPRYWKERARHYDAGIESDLESGKSEYQNIKMNIVSILVRAVWAANRIETIGMLGKMSGLYGKFRRQGAKPQNEAEKLYAEISRIMPGTSAHGVHQYAAIRYNMYKTAI